MEELTDIDLLDQKRQHERVASETIEESKDFNIGAALADAYINDPISIPRSVLEILETNSAEEAKKRLVQAQTTLQAEAESRSRMAEDTEKTANYIGKRVLGAA